MRSVATVQADVLQLEPWCGGRGLGGCGADLATREKSSDVILMKDNLAADAVVGDLLRRDKLIQLGSADADSFGCFGDCHVVCLRKTPH